MKTSVVSRKRTTPETTGFRGTGENYSPRLERIVALFAAR